jgi:hypothetical protein
MPRRKPSAAELLLAFLPRSEREALLGDLIEERVRRAGSSPNERRWFWGQVLRSIAPMLWLTLKRGRWLEIVGAAVAAYMLVRVIQAVSIVALSQVVFSGPIAQGSISLTLALSAMILGGYVAARLRRGAPVLLAMISGAMVLQWMLTAGAHAPLAAQLITLISCTVSSLLGGALVRRRAATLVVAALIVSNPAPAQARQYLLESARGLVLHNVSAEPVMFNDKRGVRLTLSAEGKARLARMTPEQQNQFEQLAVIEGSNFSSSP